MLARFLFVPLLALTVVGALEHASRLPGFGIDNAARFKVISRQQVATQAASYGSSSAAPVTSAPTPATSAPVTSAPATQAPAASSTAAYTSAPSGSGSSGNGGGSSGGGSGSSAGGSGSMGSGNSSGITAPSGSSGATDGTGASMGGGSSSGNGGGSSGSGSGSGSSGSGSGSSGSGSGSSGSGGGSSGGGSGSSGQSQRPNIVIFIADDLGHADLSYAQGNLQTPTPNIDKLAWDGIILNRHYSNPICTPTRSAFITGKYTFHTGMQTNAIAEGEPWGLPLKFPTQADLFKKLGYSTLHVGKWHLGEHQRAYFPNGRGFDYSYGLSSGECNWFNYTTGWIAPVPTSGRAVRENGKMIFANITNNVYFPELLNNKAEQLIQNSDPSVPFYLYFATPAVHTAFEEHVSVLNTMPQFQLRPPVFKFSDAFPQRKKQLGIVQVLDESFKRVTEALVHKGIINNTIIVFFADNGAPLPEDAAFTRGSNYGSNWPLRLGKGGLFEGGVRTNAFIWSPLLKKRGRVTSQLFHVTDWMPTLWEAAGGDPAMLPANGDGFSQWKSLQGGLTVGPRKELVHNIDTTLNAYSMIYEDQYGGLYKIIGGNVFDNVYLGWDRPDGTVAGDDSWKTYSPVQIECNFPEGVEVSPCRPIEADCLFDLTNDPCETNNIASSYPSMLKLLQDKIKAYNATAVPANILPFDPKSNPDLWQGLWVPWLEPSGEVYDAVPLTYEPFSPSSAF